MSGSLGDAIQAFFGGTPTAQPQAQQAAPAPMPTYDQWGRPQGAAQAATTATPTAGLLAQPQQAMGNIAPGASGYDMWGRQAPPSPQAAQGPQLPGLADIMAMLKAEQDKQAAAQALANANWQPGLLGGSEGGAGGSADHGGADSGVI